LDTAPTLGEATVLEVGPADVLVRMPSGATLRARLAFVVPYTPAPGDVLLTATSSGKAYAIGLLEGAGRTSFELPGDVAVHARGGKLSLSGDQGVSISGGEVEILSRSLKLVADAAVSKLGSLVQRVRGSLSEHLGARTTVVDGASTTKAKNVTMLSEDNVVVNGKQIHLG
jgi:hypothetical protein